MKSPNRLNGSAEVTLEIKVAQQTGCLVAPMGLDTPHEKCCGVDVEGGQTTALIEGRTGQGLLRIVPQDEHIVIRYRFAPVETGQIAYRNTLFAFHDSRYTRAAEALVEEASKLACDLKGNDRIEAIARATADRFTYGHPPERFYDNHDEIPALGCGLAEGSCVDINTYFIASLRSAGFDAGYVTGYFFPEEKNGRCHDMHCWVVTHYDGIYLEWDIAHHLKMGTREIKAGLNPKPGCRHAVAHSMGLDVPDLGIKDMKLIGEPIWASSDGQIYETFPTISRMVI